MTDVYKRQEEKIFLLWGEGFLQFAQGLGFLPFTAAVFRCEWSAFSLAEGKKQSVDVIVHKKSLLSMY